MEYLRPSEHVQFAALLWEPVLEPLERAFGPYGSIALQGFTDALAQAMEQQHA